MSEVERRRPYKAQRVLISSVAVLNPTFDDGDLYFTGPQIESMRNLMQYANRPENYAAEWEPGYYLTPDNDDWDDIQAIVADLEEVLMGNPNTLWGYADGYSEAEIDVDMPAGVSNLVGSTVPAGQVWRVTGASFLVVSATCSDVRVFFNDGVDNILVGNQLSPVSGQAYPFAFDVIMKEGDYVYQRFYNMTLNDDAYMWLWGYKMAVP